MKDDEYTCASCKETFSMGWSNEAAQAEYEHKFPVQAKHNVPVDIVCDDCYKKMMKWKTPEQSDKEFVLGEDSEE